MFHLALPMQRYLLSLGTMVCVYCVNFTYRWSCCSAAAQYSRILTSMLHANLSCTGLSSWGLIHAELVVNSSKQQRVHQHLSLSSHCLPLHPYSLCTHPLHKTVPWSKQGVYLLSWLDRYMVLSNTTYCKGDQYSSSQALFDLAPNKFQEHLCVVGLLVLLS